MFCKMGSVFLHANLVQNVSLCFVVVRKKISTAKSTTNMKKIKTVFVMAKMMLFFALIKKTPTRMLNFEIAIGSIVLASMFLTKLRKIIPLSIS